MEGSPGISLDSDILELLLVMKVSPQTVHCVCGFEQAACLCLSAALKVLLK